MTEITRRAFMKTAEGTAIATAVRGCSPNPHLVDRLQNNRTSEVPRAVVSGHNAARLDLTSLSLRGRRLPSVAPQPGAARLVTT